MHAPRQPPKDLLMAKRLLPMAMTAVLLLGTASAGPSKSVADAAMRGVRLVTVAETQANLSAAFRQHGVWNTWAEHGRFTAEVPPSVWPAVQSELIDAMGLRVTRLQPDMQVQIDAERAAREAHPYPGGSDDATASRSTQQRVDEFYEAFRNIDEVEAHINFMVERAPAGLTVERFVYGRTHLGREQIGIRVVAAGGSADHPKLWQHGVQHGGEWIAMMTTMYIADALVSGWGQDPELTRLATEMEWIFAPVVNVDGFMHSWASSTTRNWRKSRQMHAANVVALAECLEACEPDCSPTQCLGCVGVDTNRNWGYEWGDEHASADPCSNAYMGPAPWTEPEVANLRDYLRSRQSTDPNLAILGAIDHHCCGDMWMTPWGYTVDLPPDYDEHMELGLAACAAIDDVHGRNVCGRTGPIFTVISPATGCCTDFLYGDLGVKQALASELRSGLDANPQGTSPHCPVGLSLS